MISVFVHRPPQLHTNSQMIGSIETLLILALAVFTLALNLVAESEFLSQN